MKDIKTIVAKNILFYRKRKKLSQKALAEMIGVKHNTISSWESCTNSVDIDNLFKICDALNTSINVMMGIDEPSNGFSITDDEKKLVLSYRNHPEMQAAVNKMLDINITSHADNLQRLAPNQHYSLIAAKGKAPELRVTTDEQNAAAVRALHNLKNEK